MAGIPDKQRIMAVKREKKPEYTAMVGWNPRKIKDYGSKKRKKPEKYRHQVYTLREAASETDQAQQFMLWCILHPVLAGHNTFANWV